MKIRLLYFFFFISNYGSSQHFINHDTLDYYKKYGIGNLFSHFHKDYSLTFKEMDCSIDNFFHNEFYQFVIIPNQSELIYYGHL
jgi:hypothetical protein